MFMKIIVNDVSKTNIINKSKFIGIIKKVMSKDEVNDILSHIKEKYPDATHICYAYRLLNTQKYCDDSEPDGTAGLPILNVLMKNDVTYIIAIVIRYFGGIKLGSNGLIRAYSGIISELLYENIKDIEKGYLIHIEESYDNIDLINYLLKDDKIIKREYLDKVIIEAIVKEKTLEKLSNVSYKIYSEQII